MISERTLIRRYTSFWQQLMPMGREFSKYLKRRDQRYLAPLVSRIEARRRGIVNELGFRVFAATSEEGTEAVDELAAEDLARLTAETLSFFESVPPREELRPIGDDEVGEAREIARSIHRYLERKESRRPVVVLPPFSGCGVVDACHGDLLVGHTLYELKSGARRFQLDDLRQLIVYAALQQASGKGAVERFGLLNPRMGIALTFDPNEVLLMTAGRPAADVYTDLIEFVSAPANSR